MQQSRRQDTPKKLISHQFALLLAMAVVATVQPQRCYAASTANGQPQVIHLAGAVALTITQNPQLRSYVHRYEVQQGEIMQAGIGERPRLQLMVEDGLGTGEHEALNNLQSTLSYAWVLQQDRITGRVNTAESKLGQLQLEQQITALDLGALTATRFIQTLVKEAALNLNQSAVHQATEVVTAIDKRVRLGRSLAIDKQLAEAELIRRRMALEDLEHEIRSGKYQLSAMWGEARTDFTLAGDLHNLPAPAPLAAQLARLKTNPRVLQFTARQQLLQAELELARIEAKPQWQLTAGLRRYEASDDYGLIAGISLPLGNADKYASAIDKLQAGRSVLLEEERAVTQQIEAQLYVLLQEIAHSRHVIQATENEIIPTLETALTAAAAAFDAGKLNYSQWSNVREALLLARFDLLDAYERLHLQHIEIQRLSGASLDQ